MEVRPVCIAAVLLNGHLAVEYWAESMIYLLNVVENVHFGARQGKANEKRCRIVGVVWIWVLRDWIPSRYMVSFFLDLSFCSGFDSFVGDRFLVLAYQVPSFYASSFHRIRGTIRSILPLPVYRP